MNPHVTGVLRDAFEDLADSAPPPSNLARITLARARRQRIVRRTVGGGLAAAACAALVGLVGAVVPPSGGPDQVAAPGYVRRSVVTAYSGIDDDRVVGPALDYSLLLNRKTGRYDRIPYNVALPSPDGSRVLVGEGDNSPAHPRRSGILDPTSGEVRWFPGEPDDEGLTIGPGMGEWSPDGRQILFQRGPSKRVPDDHDNDGFTLMDPETFQTRFVRVPNLLADNVIGSGLVWMPDGDLLAMTASHREGDTAPAVVTEIRFYDLTGRLVRTIPAGAELSPGGVSPDGSMLALTHPEIVDSPVTIVDADTGARRATFTLGSSRLIGWVDDGHLLMRRYVDDAERTGSDDPDHLVVVDLAGRVVHTVRAAVWSQQVSIGSAEGLPASAKDLIF
jgi:hypothetical protein